MVPRLRLEVENYVDTPSGSPVQLQSVFAAPLITHTSNACQEKAPEFTPERRRASRKVDAKRAETLKSAPGPRRFVENVQM
jgi:hypothetical protein